ncbi:hypothetical protein [Streptomyces sp. NPDC005244]|uniref:hypothetical protein n=1 Tax=Streptomyces sp. NPDC005244 TaxID=3364708 RepID=UPI003687E754
MRSVLKPQYEGYYGQLVLSGGDLEEMGDLTDVRRAARGAGRRLGRQPVTRARWSGGARRGGCVSGIRVSDGWQTVR